jgi:adenylyltransferase/sulfurtransferase
MKFREFKLRKDPKCPVCGDQPTVNELIDYEVFCGLGAPAASIVDSKLEEISATELNARRLRGETIQVIDVREPHEFEIARIPNTKLIPLAHVVSRMDEIDPNVETVVHCKGGVRSAKAIEALKRAGFPGQLINLRGGITAWSEDVDPSVAKY